jgi:hypothetical protein
MIWSVAVIPPLVTVNVKMLTPVLLGVNVGFSEVESVKVPVADPDLVHKISPPLAVTFVKVNVLPTVADA